MLIKTNKDMKSQLGFTLIELVIVVAIIGILSAVAYPSFTEQIRKSKRADLVTNVLECASIQERRFTLKNTYEDDACDGLDAANDNYDITVDLEDSAGNACTSNGNENCFVITADPIGSMANDLKCTEFTYSHLGIKGADGSGSDPVKDCWRDS